MIFGYRELFAQMDSNQSRSRMSELRPLVWKGGLPRFCWLHSYLVWEFTRDMAAIEEGQRFVQDFLVGASPKIIGYGIPMLVQQAAKEKGLQEELLKKERHNLRELVSKDYAAIMKK